VGKRKEQRPIDAKDVIWSHIGKDELDKAAELVFNTLRDSDVLWDCVFDQQVDPYHVQPSGTQEVFQRAVLALLGTTVPAMLRERAKELKSDGIDVDHLVQLAEELQGEHGV
jgi:hypothetical protein